MATSNRVKTPPKNNVKFSITLSEEQKRAKALILQKPFNFVLGKAGSGKTLLAVQIALDKFFKREIDKIIITRPTVSNEDNGFLPGCPHKSIVRNGHEQATVHAEQNAIADCARRGAACEGTIAYITHYPCIICTRMLLAAGIKEINYIEDYKNDELVKPFCDQLCVKINKI